MKICQNCHAEFSDDMMFCTQCGQLLGAPEEPKAPAEEPAPTFAEDFAEPEVKAEATEDTGCVCPQCGTLCPAGFLFCTSCGASLNGEEAPVFEEPVQPEMPAEEPVPMFAEDLTEPEVKAEAAEDTGCVCPKCGTLSPAGFLFCTSCGASLNGEEAPVFEEPVQPEMPAEEPAPTFAEDFTATEAKAEATEDTGCVCPKCGTLSPAGFQFCTSCGAPLNGAEAPAEEPAPAFEPIVPVKKEKPPKPPKPPKNRTKQKYILNRVLQWVLILAVALTLAAGLGASLFLGTRHFTPLSADQENASLLSEDGTVAVHLQYAPQALTFPGGNSSQLIVGIENLSQDAISGISVDLEFPFGLAGTEETTTLSADRIGPGAIRTFQVPVLRVDPLDDSMMKVILLMAATAVVTTLFILLFAFNRKRRLPLLKSMTAATLVLALLLPSLSVFAASSSEKTIGEATLVYDEEDGIARRMSVQVSSNGAFTIGDGNDGNLSYSIRYALEQQLIVDAKIVDDENMLLISWNEISGVKQYRVYMAQEDLEFFLLDTVADTSYKTSFPYASLSYYRIIAETESGEMYSQDVLLMMDGERIFVDSDNDLLSNELELAFGTSLALEDTDGDGLSDYYEIARSLTDPLAYDSDGSGISDGDKDPDGDGLTNAQEALYGTNPHAADSDGDGLSDYEEIFVTFTDPINWDTDGDGLSDGTEYRISSDPNSADSTGDGVSDARTSFTASLTDSNESGAKLDVTDSGLGLSVSGITDITDRTTLKDLDYIASPVVEVEVSEDGEGSVTLPITKETENPDDIVLGVYDQENGDFHILEGSTVSEDGSSVTAPLTDEYFTSKESVSDNGETVSTRRMIYCAFYVANWHIQFEAPLSPERDEVFFDVEFVIDESSSMEDNSKGPINDPNRYRVSAAKTFVAYLLPGDRAAVVGFNDSARRKIELTEDLEAVSAAIDTIVGNAGGTALYNGLQDALDELIATEDPSRGRFIIALTDGQDSTDGTARYDEIIQLCTEHKIPIYTIALGTDVDTNLLSKLATYTGGSFFHIRSAEDLPQAFNRIQNNAFYGTDTDGDGLPDEVEEHGLRDGTGRVYFTDAGARFTDDDDMSDGEEAGNVMYYQIDAQGNTIQYYIMITDPTKGDTDGDGLDDLDELLMGTLPWCRDTDGDGLDDGFELSIGYNPLEANYDGDSFNDGEEYNMMKDYNQFWDLLENGKAGNSDLAALLSSIISSIGYMDPYSYDLNTFEKGTALVEGALLGDFGDRLANYGIVSHNLVNSTYYFLGQTIADFIPGVGGVTAVRDAVANLLDGDLLGMVFCLTGLIPEGGGIVKAASNICGFLSRVYSGASAYTGLFEIRNIATAPAFTYFILRAIRTIEDLFHVDLDTSSVDNIIRKQIENGTIGMTKDSARNFEIFLTYGDLYTPIRSADAVDVEDTIQLTVSNTALPVKLRDAVRTALNTKPGGVVDEKTGVYTLVRTFDLEGSEYANATTLELALQDAVDRTADYIDVRYPELEKHLSVVITDCLISGNVKKTLENITSYASKNGVQIAFYLYLTSDDTSFDESLYETQPSDKDEAILIVPGITGSELVAGQDYTGLGAISTLREGEPVWLPVDVDEVLGLIAALPLLDKGGITAELALIISEIAQGVSMIQMDSRGKPLYKIRGKQVSPKDLWVGTMGTGTEIYKQLYDAYGKDRDVIFYSYDWRRPVDEAANDLETYIELRGYSKVTFVCHSMGGVVTSCYLAKSEENRQKTEKVITIGTPYGGAPKALLALQTGEFIDSMPILNGIMRSLAYNIPAVYDLLPYDRTIQSRGGYVFDSGAMLDVQSTSSFLKGNAVSGSESSPSTGINSILYKDAQRIQDTLYASGTHIMNHSDIDAYIIAGYGSYTVNTLYENNGAPFLIGKTTAGDGTVPLDSAVWANGSLFDNPIYLVGGVQHSDLFGDKNVITLVKRIIDAPRGTQVAADDLGILTKGQEDFEKVLNGDETFAFPDDPWYSKAAWGLYDMVVAHCPVSLSLYDPDGSLVGRIGSAGIDAKEGYESFFNLLDGGETKQVILPEGYTVQVDGVDDGSMDLFVYAFDGSGTLLKELSFADIAVSEQTVVNASVEDREALTGVVLKVSNGGESYTLTEEDAEVTVYVDTENEPNLRGWILLGIGGFMILAAIISMTVITIVTRPKKSKQAKAGK